MLSHISTANEFKERGHRVTISEYSNSLSLLKKNWTFPDSLKSNLEPKRALSPFKDGGPLGKKTTQKYHFTEKTSTKISNPKNKDLVEEQSFLNKSSSLMTIECKIRVFNLVMLTS